MRPLWPVLVRSFFALWFSFIDKIYFAKHHWIGELPPKQGPLLLLANHSSWWDGIWIWQQNRLFWKWRYSVPMLQQSLQQWPFLTHLGGLPLSRSKQLANQAKAVLEACVQNDQLLLFFPEGQIRRASPKQHHFQKALLQRLLAQPKLQLVFVYQVVVTSNRPRSEVFHFLETVPLASVEELQKQYADFAAHCEDQISKHLEAKTTHV